MTLSEQKVLIVDDTKANIDVLVDTLEDTYVLSIATDGRTALEVVKEDKPDLILLDIMMPEFDGYDVCRALKENDDAKDIPVIFLTAMNLDENEEMGLDLGAVDYITKPFNPKLVKARVKNHLQLKMNQDHLEVIVKQRTKQLELTQDVIISSMGMLAEYRDPETGGHIKRTQNYVKVLAKHLKSRQKYKYFLKGDAIELLYKSAPLHDVGKVGVPDSILLKPGSLTEDEFTEMRKHAIYGKEVLSAAQRELGGDSFLKYAEEIAYTHHEKWDGTGYPLGLSGDEIPVSGRLMAIADVYDALISRRVYKPPFTHEKAKIIIHEGRGSHFDPVMVEAFMELEDIFKQIALKFADFEEERENLRK